MLFKEHMRNTRRTERFGNKGLLIGVPLNDVDFFVIEFADNALDAHAAHANASPDRINTRL